MKWIEIKYKPTVCKNYLVYTYSSKSIQIAYFNKYDEFKDDGYTIRVTHWMPLPEAPKE